MPSRKLSSSFCRIKSVYGSKDFIFVIKFDSSHRIKNICLMHPWIFYIKDLFKVILSDTWNWNGKRKEFGNFKQTQWTFTYFGHSANEKISKKESLFIHPLLSPQCMHEHWKSYFLKVTHKPEWSICSSLVYECHNLRDLLCVIETIVYVYFV